MELKTYDILSGDLTGLDITPAQMKTIRAIIAEAPRFDFYGGAEKYEFKRMELTIRDRDSFDAFEHEIFGKTPAPVYLVIETGMKNDAGTMAEIYCRKCRYLAIGPRGGIRNLHDGNGIKPGPVSLFTAMNHCGYYLFE